MWYHLQCLPSLLLDGARRFSSRAISFAKLAWRVISNVDVMLVAFTIAALILMGASTVLVVKHILQ